MPYQYYNPNPNSYQNYMMQSQMYQMPQQIQQQIPISQQMPIQQQIPVNQIQQRIQQLNGQMVDSIDAVKAKDVDLTGNPVFYPNVNGIEIYKKQLMADGTSRIIIYKAVEDEQNKQKKEQTYITSDEFNIGMNKFKEDIISEIKKAFN